MRTLDDDGDGHVSFEEFRVGLQDFLVDPDDPGLLFVFFIDVRRSEILSYTLCHVIEKYFTWLSPLEFKRYLILHAISTSSQIISEYAEDDCDEIEEEVAMLAGTYYLTYLGCDARLFFS